MSTHVHPNDKLPIDTLAVGHTYGLYQGMIATKDHIWYASGVHRLGTDHIHLSSDFTSLKPTAAMGVAERLAILSHTQDEESFRCHTPPHVTYNMDTLKIMEKNDR